MCWICPTNGNILQSHLVSLHPDVFCLEDPAEMFVLKRIFVVDWNADGFLVFLEKDLVHFRTARLLVGALMPKYKSNSFVYL